MPFLENFNDKKGKEMVYKLFSESQLEKSACKSIGSELS